MVRKLYFFEGIITKEKFFKRFEDKLLVIKEIVEQQTDMMNSKIKVTKKILDGIKNITLNKDLELFNDYEALKKIKTEIVEIYHSYVIELVNLDIKGDFDEIGSKFSEEIMSNLLLISIKILQKILNYILYRLYNIMANNN